MHSGFDCPSLYHGDRSNAPKWNMHCVSLISGKHKEQKIYKKWSIMVLRVIMTNITFNSWKKI